MSKSLIRRFWNILFPREEVLDKSSLTFNPATGLSNAPSGTYENDSVYFKIGKFFNINNPDFLWQVDHIEEDASGLLYVHLKSINDPEMHIRFPQEQFNIFFQENTFKLDEVLNKKSEHTE